MRELNVLGVFVHGVLAGLHALGIVYNVRRGNTFDVAMHSAAFTYDVWATFKHERAIQDWDGQMRWGS